MQHQNGTKIANANAPAIIFIDDATTEGRVLKENLSIFGSSKDPIKYEIIERQFTIITN